MPNIVQNKKKDTGVHNELIVPAFSNDLLFTQSNVCKNI
jgi:hypothetical protein